MRMSIHDISTGCIPLCQWRSLMRLHTSLPRQWRALPPSPSTSIILASFLMEQSSVIPRQRYHPLFFLFLVIICIIFKYYCFYFWIHELLYWCIFLAPDSPPGSAGSPSISCSSLQRLVGCIYSHYYYYYHYMITLTISSLYSMIHAESGRIPPSLDCGTSPTLWHSWEYCHEVPKVLESHSVYCRQSIPHRQEGQRAFPHSLRSIPQRYGTCFRSCFNWITLFQRAK